MRFLGLAITAALLGFAAAPAARADVPRYSAQYRDRDFALQYVRDALPEKWEKHAATIVETVWRESAKFDLNPWLVLAMVENESAFDPRAKGGVGEVGLLQLRPETAAWIARTTSLPWKGKKSLYDVKWNLTYGIHYLGWIKAHNKTKASARYLAAYNMGLKALLRKLRKSQLPKEYAQKTQKFYRKIRVDYVAYLINELSSPAKRGPAIGLAETEAAAPAEPAAAEAPRG